MAEKKTSNETNESKGIKLLIVESPSKIKTITKFLDKSYKILSTSGHVKDLPEKDLGVEIKDGQIFLNYVPIKGKGTLITNICKEAKTVNEVLLASDPDREGEAIAEHIGSEIEKATKGKIQIYRIVFNEITKPAILDAIQNKHSIDEKKVAAQQARRVLDRWVGYEVSPILWKKVAKGTSAGRVQSVAVLFICEREQEIIAFIPEESWSITAQLHYQNVQMESQLFKIKNKAAQLKNEESTKKVLQNLQGQSFVIKEINDKQRLKNPQPPFITSSLQQDAYNKLGFSVDKTMMIAQKLYEGVTIDGAQEALISYMRTDSTRLSDTVLSEIKEFVKTTLGNDYLPKKTIVYSKGGAQDAHEAIRPISIFKTPEKVKGFLEPDFYKLYDLIWRRTVACEMASAVFASRQVLISVGDDYLFKTTGSTLLFDGFLKLYLPEEDEEEKASKIPELIQKDQVWKAEKINSKQHFTEPPPRYNEASLVKELEKRGIGRPSTYATIMSTIQKRNYVEKINKRFHPTEFGKAVVKVLVENLPDIFNPSFTAGMEEHLDKIAAGDEARDLVLLNFYEKFKADLNKFVGSFDKEGARAKFVETELICPTCKENKLVIRFSKNGEFLACSGFPKCTFTSQFEKDENGNVRMVEKSEKKELDETCPNCGKNLVEKVGRYGKFAACPGYPDCKFILKRGDKSARFDVKKNDKK